MQRFETGKTYATSHVGDHTLMIYARVIGRTDKSAIITTRRHPNGQRVKIYQSEKYEYIRPLGNFSMCPVMAAVDLVEE